MGKIDGAVQGPGGCRLEEKRGEHPSLHAATSPRAPTDERRRATGTRVRTRNNGAYSSLTISFEKNRCL